MSGTGLNARVSGEETGSCEKPDEPERSKEEKDLPRLMRYAEEFLVDGLIRRYMEVLL